MYDGGLVDKGAGEDTYFYGVGVPYILRLEASHFDVDRPLDVCLRHSYHPGRRRGEE